MSLEKTLVLDDELIIRKTLQQMLHRKRHSVQLASTIAEAEKALAQGKYDLMFIDVCLPDGNGTEILERLAGQPDAPIIVMITGQGTIESAVHCMQAGAFDYVLKPFSSAQIGVILDKAAKFQKLVQVNEFLSTENRNPIGRAMVGSSKPLQELQNLIECVARTDATVLVHGETGTGKELISHAIVDASPRRNKPFIKVNCAAVSETLIESEFFGHERGAFTGATERRIGRFELADGGTLLLDEISEISLPLQAKLLRVLQEQEFERVGGTKSIKVDVRVIATTNRDLLESVKKGEFREDLYYRLNVFPLQSCPLRERHEDIPQLANHFLETFTRKHGVNIPGFSDAALELLTEHPWPGNVRELQNTIERAVILTPSGKQVAPSALPLPPADKPRSPDPAPALTLPGTPPEAPGPIPFEFSSETASPPRLLAEIEKTHILKTLHKTRGNRTLAAKIMGISIRTLRNKLNQYRADCDNAADTFNFEEKRSSSGC